MKGPSAAGPGLSAWLTVPPVLSLVLLVALILVGGEGPKAPKEVPALWMAFLLAYVFIAAGDLLARLREASAPRLSAQLLCQGIVLTALPSYLGRSSAWSWLGLALLAAGLATSLSRPGRSAPTRQKETKPQGPKTYPLAMVLEALPLPALGDGGPEGVLTNGAARELADSFGIDPDDLYRAATAQDSLDLDRQSFDILQGQGLPLALLQERKAETGASECADYFDQIMRRMAGKERGLYRVQEELARARRYRRWISAVLIRPEQIGPIDVSLSEMQRQEIFDLFVAEVADNLRDSDPIFRMAPQELLVLLPETPQAGARKFSSRIKQQALDFKPTLFGLEGASGPFLVLKTGILYYDGNMELKTDAFFEQLEESMKQNL